MSINHDSNRIAIPGISNRLYKLASLLDQPVIADIGCDHGLVCIQALRLGKVMKAYACDLREGPLEQAKANILRNGLEDRIETRLRNGIENLEDDVNQVLIAGMGGRIIEEILASNPLPESVSSLILSPHKDVSDLRQWLVDHQFVIESERMIHDGHYYPVLFVHPAMDGESQSLSETELLLGVNTLVDEDFASYLVWQRDVWKKIEEKMPESAKTEMSRRIELIDNTIASIA